jgi:hypothetical protein
VQNSGDNLTVGLFGVLNSRFNSARKVLMNRPVKYSGLLLISLFFLLFGVHVLISAYRVNDPFVFVMTFFASNFIILISAAIAVGLCIRLWRHWHPHAGQCRLSDTETDTDADADEPPRDSG